MSAKRFMSKLEKLYKVWISAFSSVIVSEKGSDALFSLLPHPAWHLSRIRELCMPFAFHRPSVSAGRKADRYCRG